MPYVHGINCDMQLSSAQACSCQVICTYSKGLKEPSLVPRPHPLTRRNGLVNQVEFLGLAHAFATM